MPTPINPYDLQLLKNQAALNRRILKFYEDGIISLTPTLGTVKYKGKLFRIADYPSLQKNIEQVIAKIRAQVYTTTVNGIQDSWNLSNKKNNVLVDKRLAGKKLRKGVKQVLYDPNEKALQQFINRKEKGLNLSDRVWKTMEPFKAELEQGIGLGISKGQSASSMAKELQKNLREPDKLFRRVRSEEGKLVLSTAARNYNPGQGVYRSSYKNALRLTRTENNGAYRTADHERWKNLPFVTGITIKLSNAHPAYDICDKLVGDYPKDFLFQGWHPQCICFATAKQMSDEEFDKLEDQILAGEPINVSGATIVMQPPAAFGQYVTDNKKMLEGLKNKPYWMRDNENYVSQTPAQQKQGGAGSKQISSQLTNISKSIKPKVNNSLNAIDLVHGDGELDNIPFIGSGSKKYQGTFTSDYTGKALRITLSNKAVNPELTIAHEMGHYLDLHSIGTKGKWNSMQKDSPVKKVIAVAEQSDAIINIKKILQDGFITIKGNKIRLSPKFKSHLQYLVHPKEIWARSYAQYIAEKSQSETMLNGLKDLAEREKSFGYSHQWDNSDFESISTAIDEMMQELGWIVNQ